jgi:hypothetical protein
VTFVACVDVSANARKPTSALFSILSGRRLAISRGAGESSGGIILGTSTIERNPTETTPETATCLERASLRDNLRAADPAAKTGHPGVPCANRGNSD